MIINTDKVDRCSVQTSHLSTNKLPNSSQINVCQQIDSFLVETAVSQWDKNKCKTVFEGLEQVFGSKSLNWAFMICNRLILNFCSRHLPGWMSAGLLSIYLP